MALLLRLNKAAPLTNAEVDDNFLYLETLASGLQNSKLATANLLTQIRLIDGTGSQIDADKLHNMAPSDQALNSSIVARDASGNFSANVITASLNGVATSATTAADLSGILTFNHGGTGSSSIPLGYVKSTGSVLTSVTSIPGTDIDGNIAGLASNVSGVVTVANGGTGVTTIQAAQSALGLLPGQTIQSYSPNLQNIAGLNGVGFICRADVAYTRILEVGNGLTIFNADGANGNPKIEFGVVSVGNGGTGANNPAAARASLAAASIESPTFQGVPQAPTAAFGTNNNQLATTAFVQTNRIPAGTILTMAHVAAPQGFLLTDGVAHSQASYQDLYAIIGTRFGSGGVGTFNVPNVSAPVGLISVIKT